MKHINLQILMNNDINVPPFIVVDNNKNIDMNFTTAEKFAIRSSFNVEDDSNNSFAGQFDTLLNVNRNNIEDAVKQVLNSYNKKSAQQYKNIQNVQDINKGHVIIQEMISADMSGIIFTANPQGILNETVIIVGNGLGNNVVEGKVNTTCYFYNNDDGIYYYEQNEDSPILKENILKELINISNKIKDIFNKEMDIEFAIKDNIIYILQARPITTLNINEIIVLDNSNIVESYPGISLPLTQSFVKDVYYNVFKFLCLRLTEDETLINNMDKDLKNMVDVVNGRIYYRINNWYSLLKLLPCEKKVIKIWQEMMGVRNLNIVHNNLEVPDKVKTKIIFNFIKYLNKCPREMKRLEKYFEKIIDNAYDELLRLKPIPDYCGPENYTTKKRSKPKKTRIESYLSLVKTLKSEISSHWDITLINDMYTFINTSLSGKKNRSLLSQINNLESLKPVIALNELHKQFEIEENKPKEKFSFDLSKKTTIPKFDLMFENYIAEYGDRCLEELKLETETYRTKPGMLYSYLKTMQEIDIPEIEDKKSFNPFINKARKGISNREISRMNRSRLFGLARIIYLRIGEELVEQNRLNNERDIFYLFEEELYDNNIDYKTLVEKRKIEYENYKSIPEYSRLVFANKIINKTTASNNSLIYEDKLYGVGISEGIVEGEVIIIDKPDINIDTNNKIIITKMTDPGWVFLIKNSKGIIAEQGSLLSHTAIISRELKKPAIANAKNILKLLKTGDIIKMNGLTGEIQIIGGSK